MNSNYVSPFLFLVSICYVCSSNSIHEHTLDLNWLNSFYHRAAVMALLRSKANTLKRVVPNDEAIVYSECERSARTVSQLARCVVGLLDVRDRNEVEQTNESEPRTQKEFYERITKFINDVLDSSKRDNILSKIRRKKATKTALENLQTIRRYTNLIERYSTQMQKINDENQRFIQNAGLPFKFQLKSEANPTMLNQVIELINRFQQNQQDNSKLSILSPSFFAFSSHHRRHLLSPSLFSLQSDGPLSLPQLFQMASIGRKETDEWIEMLLTLSGASALLQKTVEKLEPKLHELERDVYPRLREMERWQRSWKRARSTQTIEQQQKLKDDGYAFLNTNQLNLIYNIAPPLSEKAKLNAQMTERQRELRLENDIRRLAKLEQELSWKRVKRALLDSSTDKQQRHQTTLSRAQFNRFVHHDDKKNGSEWVEITRDVDVKIGPKAHNQMYTEATTESIITTKTSLANSCAETTSSTRCSPLSTPTSTVPTSRTPKQHDKEKEEEELPKFETLAPFAFGSRINESVVLEALTLSPYAFWNELIQPEFASVMTLSPRAFVASTLSPMAAVARILTPSCLVDINKILTVFLAFRSEILSPRTMTAFVLSPEALILEVRVASPEALIIQILSPNALAPKIYSPEALGLLILSPSFLSPRIKSQEKLMIEILSPNILGGSESHEEDAYKEHDHHECCAKKESEEHVDIPQPHSPRAMRDWT
ncbi:Moulting cycle MLT-10-like protein family-containing protein [Aphelenchoides besseyi]|nr:Moulting cycle MLT-10-like protein family-containing protein [Aphelenchoides besseyi]